MADQMMTLDQSPSSTPPTTMSRHDTERYSCPSCSKSFVRKAHMLRHQQQHATQKPFNCTFCSKSFKRSDVLRAHQFRCKERGDAPVPEGQSKGRKRSSCASCVKLRTRCDQETPCSRCVELGKDCVRATTSHPNPTRRLELARPKSRDAIPIAHLLNSPPDDDFGGRFPVPETEEDGNTAVDLEDESEASHWSEEIEPYDQYTGAVDTTAFDSFFDGLGEPVAQLFWSSPLRPFGQHQIPETLAFNTSILRSEVVPGFGPMTLGMTDPRLATYEARAHEVREVLKLTANSFGTTLPESQAMLGLGPNIAMLTGSETASLVDLFFQHYHKHCPILHKPSFDLTLVPMALLLPVLALGGMYAPDKGRVERMRSLLDVIELYVFNLPGLRDEFPFSVDLSQAPDDETAHAQFQILQGGYLLIVAQYFSGNLAAKRRARRQRFMRVLDVARSFKLPLAQHSSFIINDERSWQNWIRQENRIRHFNIMIAFDAAMAIFNNVPPRITFSELDLAMPTEQHFWEMGSYAELASQPLFPRPRPKLMDLFQLLFVPATDFQSATEKVVWNCWDMLYLVHLLYCHVWRQTFSNPLLRRSPYSTPAPANILEPLKTAIRNWKTLWDDVRSRLSQDQLRGMGFETSADSYWTLTKLILQAFDVSHVRSGNNYAASNSESASASSPAADYSNAGVLSQAKSSHHRHSSQGSYTEASGRHGPSLQQAMQTNGTYSDYNAYNLAATQGGPTKAGPANDMAINANTAHNPRYGHSRQHSGIMSGIPPPLKQEDEIVNASGLPPGLGLTGNYTLSSGSAGGGMGGLEPSSATTTEFGGGHDFMPLEADCDTQGAHLKKILRGTTRP